MPTCDLHGEELKANWDIVKYPKYDNQFKVTKLLLGGYIEMESLKTKKKYKVRGDSVEIVPPKPPSSDAVYPKKDGYVGD